MENFNTKYNKILKDIIRREIKDTFKNVKSSNDLDLIIEYLHDVVMLSGGYFIIDQTEDDYFAKLTENNYQDIYSFLVLLLPYLNLSDADKVNNIKEIIFDKNKLSKLELDMRKEFCKSIGSFYYVDHENDDIEKYFKKMMIIINDGFYNFSTKLHPNWVNIIPLTLNDYKKSNYWLNLVDVHKNKKYSKSDKIFWKIKNNVKNYKERNCYIGNCVIYGTISKFLYEDIKDIKWLIYDVFIKRMRVYPTIIYLCHAFDFYGKDIKINNIANEKLEYLTDDRIKKLEDAYKILVEKASKDEKFYSEMLYPILLFYLRKNKNNINKLKNEYKLNDNEINDLFLKKDENEIYDDNEEYDVVEENLLYSKYKTKIENILRKVSKNIKFEDFYEYLFESIQKFKYTWYGYMCMNDKNEILVESEYLKKYKDNFGLKYQIFKGDNRIGFITLKTIYNFCKSLSCDNFKDGNNKFIQVNKFGNWEGLSEGNKDKFINKMNGVNSESWFNISRNLKKIYNNDEGTNKYLQSKITEILTTDVDFIPAIILKISIINGMLSKMVYDKKMSNKKLIPNRSLSSMYKKYILENVQIDKYGDSYSFLSNNKISLKRSEAFDIEDSSNIKSVLENIKNSIWYTNFSGNWVCQIQIYTHYLNQRVMFVTGSTGVGKSSVFPMLLLYGEKMINFNNNAKLFCSQPRINPTEKISRQLSENSGYPIEENIFIEEYSSLTKTDKRTVKYPINYFQYKHGTKKLNTDDYYHPTIRLYTDGALYNEIRKRYIYKEYTEDDEKIYLQQNFFDILLVDEAHEHNTNMDMILTLARFGNYINNKITLGIVSATMEGDEERYREYYSYVNDNWKCPLDLRYLNKKDDNFVDKNILDRRIHLSEPFGGTNYEIEKISKYKLEELDQTDIKKVNERVMKILKIILANKGVGKNDILIFMPGQKEIKDIIQQINKETPSNVLALPFYKDLTDSYKEDFISEIAKDDIRDNITICKNQNVDKFTKYDIESQKGSNSVNKKTYDTFIIVATNIAEASITIGSLSYVIDTGIEKINRYNYLTKDEMITPELISEPSYKQRTGRVGRIKPGKAYYTYDNSKLSPQMPFKIRLENLSELIIKLLSDTDKEFINDKNDPNFSSLDELVKIIVNQYSYVDDEGYLKKYENDIRDNKKIPYYPDYDGKYNKIALIDKDESFYLINPEYENQEKVLKILEVFIKKDILNYNDTFTNYGKKILLLSDFFSISTSLSSVIENILDNYQIIKKRNNFIEELVAFIILKSNNIIVKKSIKKFSIISNCDFLIYLQVCKLQYEAIINKASKSKIEELFVKKGDNSDINDSIAFISQLNKMKKELEDIYLFVYEDKQEIEKSENNNLEIFIKKYKKIVKEQNIYFRENNENIFLLNDYELLCYFIIKNVPENLFKKIDGTIYYMNFINRNVNNIYKIECIKDKLLTRVSNNLINYLIYSLKISGQDILSNIMWVPAIVIQIINSKSNSLVIDINSKFDEKYSMNKYGDEYNSIYKNLSLIISSQKHISSIDKINKKQIINNK